MSDLVKRLRCDILPCLTQPCVSCEAANEIETLRLVNAALRRRLELVHTAIHTDVEFHPIK